MDESGRDENCGQRKLKMTSFDATEMEKVKKYDISYIYESG